MPGRVSAAVAQRFEGAWRGHDLAEQEFRVVLIAGHLGLLVSCNSPSFG
jgi:hypothetical protein